MQIEPGSLPYLRRCPGAETAALQTALQPLLDEPLGPIFAMHWDERRRAWCSQFAASAELPHEIQEVFERTGYGCLAVETDIGIVHVCHAADRDIDRFANKPVESQWQLIKMRSGPLIRLELVILDDPAQPYLFESFLNVAEKDQARVLAQLIRQDRLRLAFYGDHLNHRFTKIVPQDVQQRQQLAELVQEAIAHWAEIPAHQRDYDRAKEEFIRRFV
jgi:hypothetical protein